MMALARQGDPDVIGFLINQALRNQGITASVVCEDGCLHILLEASSVPPQQACVEFIANGLQRLQLSSALRVRVYGGIAGVKPSWSQVFDVGRVPLKKPIKVARKKIKKQRNLQLILIRPLLIFAFSSLGFGMVWAFSNQGQAESLANIWSEVSGSLNSFSFTFPTAEFSVKNQPKQPQPQVKAEEKKYQNREVEAAAIPFISTQLIQSGPPASIEDKQTPKTSTNVEKNIVKTLPRTTINIKAVGDIIPGSNYPYNKLPASKESLFKAVKPYLQGSDILFGNFESTMTNYPYSAKDVSRGMTFAFRSPPSYNTIFKDAGFDVLSVANNHSFDFFEQGFKDTIENLEKVGIKTVGRKNQILYKNVKGVTVAFIGFSTYDAHNTILDLSAAKKLVNEAKQKASVVVISVHAGAEGTDAINVRNREEFFYGENRGNMVLFSRTMIDAGADLILGHGPHVPRAVEVYKGKLIAYSLGNFLGYQTLSTVAELGYSLILEVAVNEEGDFVEGKILPVHLDGQGVPYFDQKFRSVGLIRSLMASDFPNTPLTIDNKGKITKK
nr:CapA family protein [Ancylothrix sp. D3o]